MESLECRTCADCARQHGEQAIGTVTGFEQFLIVEVPLPWPSAVTAAKGLPPGLYAVIEEASKRKLSFRFEAIAPDAEWSQPGMTRMIQYESVRLDDSFDEKVSFRNGFRRQEYLLPTDQVAGAAAALLYAPEQLPTYAEWALAEGPTRELLVCTQGSRDAACGHYGYPLYRAIREEWCGPTNPRLRVWRASHIGGHRFAGTMLDFPTGLGWGHLTEAELAPLLTQGDLDALVTHLRGSLAPISHWEQIAEGRALQEVGWEYLAEPRRTRLLDQGPGWAEVQVETLRTARRWRARISEQGQVVSQPNTKGPLRSESQYQITSWQEERPDHLV